MSETNLKSQYRTYYSIFRIRLLSGLQYRAAAFAGLAINLFWGLILVTILILFYRLGKRQDAGMTLQQGITYIWLAQCFINLVSLQPDPEVYQKVASGDLAYELCRPLDIYAHWYTRAAAIRIANTVLKSGLALTVCLLLPKPYGMQLPASIPALAAATLALAGALLLACAFSNLMNVFLLKVELGPGLSSLLFAVSATLSGQLVPLAVFPDWLVPVLRFLPFAGLMDFPCALYTGLIPVSDAWTVIGRQLMWAAVLMLLGRWGLGRGLRRTVIQGG